MQLKSLFAMAVMIIWSNLAFAADDEEEGYTTINAVSANTNTYGSFAAWGAFIKCTFNTARAVKDAVNISLAAYGGANGVGVSAREDILDQIYEHYNQIPALEVYGVDFDYNPNQRRDDNGQNNAIKITLVAPSANNLVLHTVVHDEKFGAYTYGNTLPANQTSELGKRADYCKQGTVCHETYSEYFNQYFIGADVCKQDWFRLTDMGGSWSENTVGHLRGNDYCSDYYKLYMDHGSYQDWVASWRVYQGSGSFTWSRCDTGH
ncbi:uncharacterized protein KGF55_004704 [Candida pseudojiufengensis]|uniref:uncharacterized protein n=1 Tax=Candida pseudojiufengensis TaxID=497109 RepID=UPI00222511AC|nr:uncharacterized protein KGF55_004704 [Candida pseudojiufengensis]KAI5960412.1 hypothetical protein KGF55_004704 [Candida pseudojiufengensis]